METESIIALWTLLGRSQQPTFNHSIPHAHTLFALPEMHRHTCLFHINRNCTQHEVAISRLYLYYSILHCIVIFNSSPYLHAHKAVFQIPNLVFRSRASLLFARLPPSPNGSHSRSPLPIATRKQSQPPQTVFRTCCPSHWAFAPLSSIATMPFKKQPSSMTYPSAPGSDVHRSASFWSLPSLDSTPACSIQSVQTQRSKDCQGRLKVLLDCPAHSENTRVLEEADMWRADKLRVKLSSMAEACREWEAALAKSALVSGYAGNTSLLSNADANLPRKDHAPTETGPAAADEALKLQEGHDAALQASAEKSKCTQQILSVFFPQGSTTVLLSNGLTNLKSLPP